MEPIKDVNVTSFGMFDIDPTEETKVENAKVARPTTNPTLRGVRTAEDIANNEKKLAPIKLDQAPQEKESGSNA